MYNTFDIYQILAATNVVLIIIIIAYMIRRSFNKKELFDLKEQILNEKLIAQEANRQLHRLEIKQKRLIFSISKAMNLIKESKQEIGTLKRSISRFFGDLMTLSLSDDTFLDDALFDEVIDFIDGDLCLFLTNESTKLSNDKFFKLIEKLDIK